MEDHLYWDRANQPRAQARYVGNAFVQCLVVQIASLANHPNQFGSFRRIYLMTMLVCCWETFGIGDRIINMLPEDLNGGLSFKVDRSVE